MRNKDRQGDGWLAVDINDGKLLICVIDISLAGERVGGIDGKDITEARLLLDATETMRMYTEEHSPTITPFDLLNMMTGFDPSYLKPWKVCFKENKEGIEWGFSITAALFDREADRVDVANLGTNAVAQERPGGKFGIELGPNRYFFSSYPLIPPKAGRKISMQRKALPAGRRILLATDGISIERHFLRLRPPKIVIDDKGDPSSLLVSPMKEGLYLVIQKSV